MPAKRRRAVTPGKTHIAGRRGQRGKTGRRGPAGKSVNGHALTALAQRLDDVTKELARLLRRIGEIQAQLDQLVSDEERTGTG